MLVELTVCFQIEDNLDDARSHEEAKYADLVDEIEANGFVVDLVTVEEGARGFVHYKSFRHLNDSLGASQKSYSISLWMWSRLTKKLVTHFDPKKLLV